MFDKPNIIPVKQKDINYIQEKGVEILIWKDGLKGEGRRYVGADVSRGIEQSLSTAVCVDEDYNVIAVAHTRSLAPELWAEVIARMFRETNTSVVACENNSIGYSTVVELRRLIGDTQLYRQKLDDTRKLRPSDTFGFQTNGKTKEIIITKLQRDIGQTNIPSLFGELLSHLETYTTHDLMSDREKGSTGLRHNHDYVIGHAIGNFVATQPKERADISLL